MASWSTFILHEDDRSSTSDVQASLDKISETISTASAASAQAFAKEAREDQGQWKVAEKVWWLYDKNSLRC